MIGLARIAYHVPDERVDNLELARALGATEALVRDKIGFLRAARKPDASETSDLAIEAVRKLLADARMNAAELQLLVVVTQNPDGRGLPHTSAVLHGKLDLPSACAAFDMSLGCSGFVYGIATAAALMETSGLKRGILVTADPYSKVVDQRDRDTALLFGDGAAAALLTDEPVWRIGRCDFGTQGQQRENLMVGADGKLRMNGRGVYNFSATEVPASIQRTLAMNGLALADIDRFILHQGSRYLVETIAKRLGISDRTEICAQDYGNLVSSSVPVAFAECVKEADRRVLLSGFGVGLSWATTVVTRA
jgi:3-oxoacyl-[acyl-carrier-protein] synthase III